MTMPDLKKFKHLPKFSDGRIDFSTSNIAPVVTVFIEFGGKILMLKRSDKVRTYQGVWNTVAGYIDEDKPIEYFVKKELREEIGIYDNGISGIKLGESFELDDKKIKKRWIVYPALVTLNNKPHIELDWEHSDHAWIKPEEIVNYQTVYRLEESLQRVTKITPN